jgi:hypothetical protein
MAVFLDQGREQENTLVDLASDPTAIAHKWLNSEGA